MTERDRLAARHLQELLAGPVQAGAKMTLGPDIVQRMRAAFATGHTRAACLGCQWSDLCSAIAAEGYRGTRVHGAR